MVFGAFVKPEQPAVLQACTAYCSVWLDVGDAISALVPEVVATVLDMPVSRLLMRTLYDVAVAAAVHDT
ncbi:hypothetical protein RhoFW510T8_00130 [Rhodanobacter sp. FW510-T8]|nr:hypothetical protein RhoFW510T8_00130 [Rhodanobacter sp. FW510-T8]